MVHHKRFPPAAAARSTEMLEMFPRGLISMEHVVPSCAEKGGTQSFHIQSMENLWKSFNNILWTTEIYLLGLRFSESEKKASEKESWCYSCG